MAVTLTSTGITFSDASSQNTAATAGSTVSNIQYAAYVNSSPNQGPQAVPTSASFLQAGGVVGGQDFDTRTGVNFTINQINMSNQMVVGHQYYRVGNLLRNPGNVFGQDGGTDTGGYIRARTVYRTITA